MSDIFVHPGRLRGSITPPPSKSDAHRALIAAALAGDTGKVAGLPADLSQDLQATISCLEALFNGQNLLDCHESGTTLRLLVPVAAALGAAVTFNGSGRLPARPLAEYASIFAGHGICLEFPAEGSLPLVLGGRLTGGEFHVPGHISSQYISGLLFALPLLREDSKIILTSPLESGPYVDMTIKTLSRFGVLAEKKEYGFFVPGGQTFMPADYVVEKDYSQAAFWLVAAYAGSQIEVTGLDPDSAQGDREIYRLLEDFARGYAGYRIDVAQIPDLVPALAVAAALTSARTDIVNAARLRIKESDRLAAISGALDKIGADIRQTEDGLEIFGGSRSRRAQVLTGGCADSCADHRIAMALAIAALSTRDGIMIKRAHVVRKSYPGFFSDLRQLGGRADEFNVG